VTTDKLAGMAAIAIVKNLPYFSFGNLATLVVILPEVMMCLCFVSAQDCHSRFC